MRSEQAFFALVVQQGCTVRIKQDIMEDILDGLWIMKMHYDPLAKEFIYTAEKTAPRLSGLEPTGVVTDEFHPINQSDEE